MATNLSDNQKRLLVVRIGFEGEPSTFKNVPRFRLNPTAVNKVFNCDIEFLQNVDDGTIVFPDSWVQNCLPPPHQYIIREKVWPTLEPDALEQSEYRGGSRIVVEHCPPNVTASALSAWLRVGLMDDDAEFAEHAQRLKELKGKLDSVLRMIRELPATRMEAANPAAELEAKKERAKLLNTQKERLEREVSAQEARWAELEGGYDDTAGGAFKLKLAENRQPINLNTWEVVFAQTAKAQRMAYIAVHKYNWRDFRLAVKEADGSEPLTGKSGEFEPGALPPGHVEVNMRDVVIARRKHGRGLYRFPDERGFYSGQWRHGLRHGQGVEINEQGRFQGGFRKDWRRGPGSQVSSTGDVYRGPYGTVLSHARESLLFGDEYADGLPEGMGRTRFVDGSVYEGIWRAGLPQGKGRYIGADGVILEGEFGPWGRLNGLGTAHGRSRIGRWRHGQLHGQCTEMDADAGSYEGGFKLGQRSGYGEEETALLHNGKYGGWWRHGKRAERGIINFCEPPLGSMALGPSAAAERQIEAAVLRAAAAERAAREEKDDEEEDGGGSSDRQQVNGRAGAPLSFLPLQQRASNSETTSSLSSSSAAAQSTAAASSHQHHPHLIPYKGDYQAETSWAGGLLRGQGVFTYRRGSSSYLRHSLGFIHSGANLQLPHVGMLPQREAEVLEKRAKQIRTAYKATLDARLTTEADNAASFEYWRSLADSQFRGEFMRRTRRLRRNIDLLREDVTGAKAPPADLSFNAMELAELAAQEEYLDPPDGDGGDDHDEEVEGGRQRGDGMVVG